MRTRTRLEDAPARVLADAIPVLVWRSDARGRVNYINAAWSDYSGGDDAASHGDDWTVLVEPCDREWARVAWEQARDSGRPLECELRLRRWDGERRWFLMRADPLHAFGPAVVGWIGTGTDIDAQKTTSLRSLTLYAEQHRIAHTLQTGMLPKALPEVAGLRFEALYESGAAEALVGGDWFDAFTVRSGEVVLAVGDVAGKGIEAAATMAAVRHAMRGAATVDPDPAWLLAAGDAAVAASGDQSFATAWVGVLRPDDGRLRYACAGHPPPILRSAGVTRRLGASGVALGLASAYDVQFVVQSMPFAPDSLLVLFTDGLTENTRDAAAGEELLAALLSEVPAPSSARALRDAMLGPLPARDDVAILLVQS